MLLLLCSGSMMLSLLLLEQLRTSVPNAYNERRYDFTVKNKNLSTPGLAWKELMVSYD